MNFEDFSMEWSEIYQYLLIPFFIFFARVLDVSMSTIRIMFVWAGNRWFATLLGFFEALVWIIAIGQIMKDITNWVSYIAYAGGFASGTFVGMYMEEKLAYGRSIIRIITKTPALGLIEYLKAENYGVTSLEADGHGGKVNIIYTVLKRKQVNCIIGKIKEYNPRAFYTIENVRYVSDGQPVEKSMLRQLYESKRK